jgi:hypothetical protein
MDGFGFRFKGLFLFKWSVWRKNFYKKYDGLDLFFGKFFYFRYGGDVADFLLGIFFAPELAGEIGKEELVPAVFGLAYSMGRVNSMPGVFSLVSYFMFVDSQSQFSIREFFFARDKLLLSFESRIFILYYSFVVIVSRFLGHLPLLMYFLYYFLHLSLLRFVKILAIVMFYSCFFVKSILQDIRFGVMYLYVLFLLVYVKVWYFVLVKMYRYFERIGYLIVDFLDVSIGVVATALSKMSEAYKNSMLE